MKCYPCAKSEQSSEAVAVCSVCGKGLCLQHAVERDLPLVLQVSGWVNQSLVHILCEDCAKVKTPTD